MPRGTDSKRFPKERRRGVWHLHLPSGAYRPRSCAEWVAPSNGAFWFDAAVCAPLNPNPDAERPFTGRRAWDATPRSIR